MDLKREEVRASGCGELGKVTAVVEEGVKGQQGGKVAIEGRAAFPKYSDDR